LSFFYENLLVDNCIFANQISFDKNIKNTLYETIIICSCFNNFIFM
jgi:hypothetical protein